MTRRQESIIRQTLISLGRNLASLRNLRGYSLDELAATSGIAIECLQAAEAGNLDHIAASDLVQLGVLLGKADRLSMAFASESLFEEYERRTHETA